MADALLKIRRNDPAPIMLTRWCRWCMRSNEHGGGTGDLLPCKLSRNYTESPHGFYLWWMKVANCYLGSCITRGCCLQSPTQVFGPRNYYRLHPPILSSLRGNFYQHNICLQVFNATFSWVNVRLVERRGCSVRWCRIREVRRFFKCTKIRPWLGEPYNRYTRLFTI